MPNIVHFCDDSRPLPRPILDSIIGENFSLP